MANERLSSEERKNEILNKSLEILHKEGYANLTLRSIADQIGISQAAIYRHFRHKNQIIDHLTELAFLQPLSTSELNQYKPVDLLKSIMFSQMQRLEKNPYLTAITFQDEIFREYADVKEKFDHHRQQREQLLMLTVQKGQNQGVFLDSVDPEVFSLIYMGSMRMAVLRWRSQSFSYSLVEQGEKIIQELLGLLMGTKQCLR